MCLGLDSDSTVQSAPWGLGSLPSGSVNFDWSLRRHASVRLGSTARSMAGSDVVASGALRASVESVPDTDLAPDDGGYIIPPRSDTVASRVPRHLRCPSDSEGEEAEFEYPMDYQHSLYHVVCRNLHQEDVDKAVARIDAGQAGTGEYMVLEAFRLMQKMGKLPLPSRGPEVDLADLSPSSEGNPADVGSDHVIDVEDGKTVSVCHSVPTNLLVGH